MSTVVAVELREWETRRAVTHTVTVPQQWRASFPERPRDWDGPEVLHALCIAGVLGEADFGGQGDLVGWDLVEWEVAEE